MSETVGDRVKKLRKYNKLNQKQFGNSIGLVQNTISQIENNFSRLTVPAAYLICDRYNIDIDWLLTGEGEMLRRDPPVPPADQVVVQKNVIIEEDPEIFSLLQATQRVLRSTHPSAPEALKSNILCFNDAVDDDQTIREHGIKRSTGRDPTDQAGGEAGKDGESTEKKAI